jgi:hypothetical protein
MIVYFAIIAYANNYNFCTHLDIEIKLGQDIVLKYMGDKTPIPFKLARQSADIYAKTTAILMKYFVVPIHLRCKTGGLGGLTEGEGLARLTSLYIEV